MFLIILFLQIQILYQARDRIVDVVEAGKSIYVLETKDEKLKIVKDNKKIAEIDSARYARGICFAVGFAGEFSKLYIVYDKIVKKTNSGMYLKPQEVVVIVNRDSVLINNYYPGIIRGLFKLDSSKRAYTGVDTNNKRFLIVKNTDEVICSSRRIPYDSSPYEADALIFPLRIRKIKDRLYLMSSFAYFGGMEYLAIFRYKYREGLELEIEKMWIDSTTFSSFFNSFKSATILLDEYENEYFLVLKYVRSSNKLMCMCYDAELNLIDYIFIKGVRGGFVDLDFEYKGRVGLVVDGEPPRLIILQVYNNKLIEKLEMELPLKSGWIRENGGFYWKEKNMIVVFDTATVLLVPIGITSVENENRRREEKEIKIYTNRRMVYIDNIENEDYIEVFNILGQQVKVRIIYGRPVIIDFYSQSAGVYFIRIKNRNKIFKVLILK
ncbi:T9SS type A sorting domain-containing protein [Candidatus Kryptobacter tengchongensis]|uniref:T9SS type A sorting domain-containing protein n=1 Tax=Kryptobacter tengchongensis TaxID=1643429 RepID=UPI0007080372|nr:T9SS type A sorting domain-containing protein [Candidatus Kryptobacter tengchongensis]CUS84788.1 Por secretion system C-terminal sorting domain-containing protein [Candidatus Kryptobacter tengchongensis]